MEIKHRFVGFDYEEAELVDEINRNLSVLYATPAGTCAGDRNYGLNQDFVGLPTNVAENLLTLEIIEKTEEYEPRAQVIQVNCYSTDQGQTGAEILIGPADEYDPDQYLQDYDEEEEETEEDYGDEEEEDEDYPDEEDEDGGDDEEEDPEE